MVPNRACARQETEAKHVNVPSNITRAIKENHVAEVARFCAFGLLVTLGVLIVTNCPLEDWF